MNFLYDICLNLVADTSNIKALKNDNNNNYKIASYIYLTKFY